jgi:hypothetical protein
VFYRQISLANFSLFLYPMIDYNLVYSYCDQPTTCPICGARTEIILNLSHTKEKTEIHECLWVFCKYKFIIQEDEDFIP